MPDPWIIRVQCDTCGQQTVNGADLTVIRAAWCHRYRFNCPKCHTWQTRDCTLRIGELLAGTGVAWIKVADPIIDTPTMPALTDDTFLDIWQALHLDPDALDHELDGLR